MLKSDDFAKSGCLTGLLDLNIFYFTKKLDQARQNCDISPIRRTISRYVINLCSCSFSFCKLLYVSYGTAMNRLSLSLTGDMLWRVTLDTLERYYQADGSIIFQAFGYKTSISKAMVCLVWSLGMLE